MLKNHNGIMSFRPLILHHSLIANSNNFKYQLIPSCKKVRRNESPNKIRDFFLKELKFYYNRSIVESNWIINIQTLMLNYFEIAHNYTCRSVKKITDTVVQGRLYVVLINILNQL